MTSHKVPIPYRGWTIAPSAFPDGTGNWRGTCEIRQIDGPSSSGILVNLGSVVRPTEDEAITEICEQAKREIDATFADAHPTDDSPSKDYKEK